MPYSAVGTLTDLSKRPCAVHTKPTNRCQQFVNASVFASPSLSHLEAAQKTAGQNNEMYISIFERASNYCNTMVH